MLSNNTASNNDDGIWLYYSSNDNTLSNNTADSNNHYGIQLRFSSNDNTLSNNTASNNEYGIWLYYSSSNTLSNNTASNNYYGIYLEASSSNTLENNTADSNNHYGIQLRFSSSNTLSNNTADSNNDDGIWLYSSSSNTLENNTADSNNDYGIYLRDSSNNTLENNIASNNQYGIYLWDSSDNFIYNNYFNNTNNVYFEGTNPGNIWNTTKTTDSNIVSGPYLSGNFWATPTENGFSQTHDDTDGDGICYVAYDLGGGNIDYLPLLIPSPEETPEPKNDGGDDPDPPMIPEPSDEPTEIIAITETSQKYVQEGTSVNYVFQNPENCIVAVSFIPENTVGFVIAKVEMLNGFSSEVLAPPKCIVYKIMNIKIGNPEFSSFEGNFKNPTIKFRVENAWIKENNIDVSTITLNRYSEGKWNSLPTSKVSEDTDFIYFVAETPAFSLFSITGRTIDIPDPGPEKKGYSEYPVHEKSNSVPGFKLWNGVLGLLISIMVKRNLRK